jgi:hypothetical protein
MPVDLLTASPGQASGLDCRVALLLRGSRRLFQTESEKGILNRAEIQYSNKSCTKVRSAALQSIGVATTV